MKAFTFNMGTTAVSQYGLGRALVSNSTPYGLSNYYLQIKFPSDFTILNGADITVNNVNTYVIYGFI